MGNIVITVSLRPNISDSIIQARLKKLTIDMGLNTSTDPKYFAHKPDKYNLVQMYQKFS
jgi:hypothetical protein